MLCKTAQDTLRDLYIASPYLAHIQPCYHKAHGHIFASKLWNRVATMRHRPGDDSDWKITDLLKCCIVNRAEYPVADILTFQLLWRLGKMLDSTISEAGHGNTRYHGITVRYDELGMDCATAEYTELYAVGIKHKIASTHLRNISCAPDKSSVLGLPLSVTPFVLPDGTGFWGTPQDRLNNLYGFW